MGSVSTSGGRRQSAGVFRSIKTQSEFWRQVARRAPRAEISAGDEQIVGGTNNARMSLHEDGMAVEKKDQS